MSSRKDAEEIAAATGRKAVPFASFSGTEDFEAINQARDYMDDRGYYVGPMCCDEPMACSKESTYVAKWRNIDRSEWPKIDAVIVSENFRNGPFVSVYQFVKE